MILAATKRVTRGAATGIVLVVFVGSAIGRDLTPQSLPNESSLDRHGHYSNVDGNPVHQPANSLNGSIPAGASAQCRDGDYSFSQHPSGTCSKHGGVARWLH